LQLQTLLRKDPWSHSIYSTVLRKRSCLTTRIYGVTAQWFAIWEIKSEACVRPYNDTQMFEIGEESKARPDIRVHTFWRHYTRLTSLVNIAITWLW
jgi:hypothetical protein